MAIKILPLKLPDLEIKKTTPILKVEVFGSVAPGFIEKNEKKARQPRMENDSDTGLGASVWTADLERGKKLAEKLECGAVFRNGIWSKATSGCRLGARKTPAPDENWKKRAYAGFATSQRSASMDERK